MKRITAWSVWNKKEGCFVHNHIEDGWVAGRIPKPLKPEFTTQTKAWSGKIWLKAYGYINDNQRVDICFECKSTYPVSKISSKQTPT